MDHLHHLQMANVDTGTGLQQISLRHTANTSASEQNDDPLIRLAV